MTLEEKVQMDEIRTFMGAESGSGLVNLRVLGPFWVEGSIDGRVYKRIVWDQIWCSVRALLP